MKRILVFAAVILMALAASCSGQKNLFGDFKEKFPLMELPLRVPYDCSDRYANDPSNLSQVELIELLKLDTDVWKTGDEYYYNTGCRFTVDKEVEAILYYRSYLPFDFSKQKSECVLAIFRNDQLADSLVIQGHVGDDLSFNSTISKELEITVQFEQLTLDEGGESHSTTNTERYSINGRGDIVPIETKKK